jgi:hypothetical protein
MESEDVMVSPQGIRLRKTVSEVVDYLPDGSEYVKRDIMWIPIKNTVV